MKELQNTELLLTQIIYSVKLKRNEIKSNDDKNKSILSGLKSSFKKLLDTIDEMKVKNELNLQEEFHDVLNKVRQLRNYFAHDIFKDYAEIEGMIEMNSENWEEIFLAL